MNRSKPPTPPNSCNIGLSSTNYIFVSVRSAKSIISSITSTCDTLPLQFGHLSFIPESKSNLWKRACDIPPFFMLIHDIFGDLVYILNPARGNHIYSCPMIVQDDQSECFIVFYQFYNWSYIRRCIHDHQFFNWHPQFVRFKKKRIIDI